MVGSASKYKIFNIRLNEEKGSQLQTIEKSVKNQNKNASTKLYIRKVMDSSLVLEFAALP